MRFRYELRLTPADVGRRVVVRWRRPAGDVDEVADVLGVLQRFDASGLAVLTRGAVVAIPLERVLAGKVVPPPPVRRTGRQEPGGATSGVSA